jgi:hypothetical protein
MQTSVFKYFFIPSLGSEDRYNKADISIDRSEDLSFAPSQNADIPYLGSDYNLTSKRDIPSNPSLGSEDCCNYADISKEKSEISLQLPVKTLTYLVQDLMII